MSTFDIEIEIRLLTEGEGGRKHAISGEVFGCPLLVDGEAFECRLQLGGRTLELGQTYVVPVKFMNPMMARARLELNKPISLWEGKIIANGKVVILR